MAETRHTKVLIIGSGPAGYTAGVYASRAMLQPLLVQGIEPGGQLTTTTEVENWPGDSEVQGPDLMIRMQDHAKAMGCDIIGDIITSLDTSQRPFVAKGDSGTTYVADAVILASGGYGKIYYLSTLAMNCNATAIWRAHKRGAYFAAPSWTQFHPTSLPQMGDHQSKLTLMSESLRNDGRIWVPKKANDPRKPGDIPEEERDYYLERRYPSFGNLAPRDIASRAAKERTDAGFGVGPMKNGVYLDFKHAIEKHGQEIIAQRYGNLFRMYEKITGINAYQQPMLIAPSAHFSMGGLWVDFELMSNVPGLFVLGEANFSDHGANRLGANSLLQACVDGYFIAPHTVMSFLSKSGAATPDAETAQAQKSDLEKSLATLLAIKGTTTAEEFHRDLGKILYGKCGLRRERAQLLEAKAELKALKERFYQDLLVPGTQAEINFELEKAGRVADYLELGALIVEDALQREESCGAHFREEYQTEDGEAKRNDADYQYVSVWESTENDSLVLHKETLQFDEVQPTQRSYK